MKLPELLLILGIISIFYWLLLLDPTQFNYTNSHINHFPATLCRITCYDDQGIMANNQYVNEGCVAVSDRKIALGTKIRLGDKTYTVSDRTALWVHKKFKQPTIDVWQPNCKGFGRQYKNVIIK